eukprot:m.225867 g.225867  ORF g.225867 m.225867 type:complete len:102 (+) comp26391_c0_seq2:46-351(+)
MLTDLSFIQSLIFSFIFSSAHSSSCYPRLPILFNPKEPIVGPLQFWFYCSQFRLVFVVLRLALAVLVAVLVVAVAAAVGVALLAVQEALRYLERRHPGRVG